MLMVIMCRTLSELLGAAEPMFTQALRHLEHVTGNPSADVRLQAEILGKVQQKKRHLVPYADDATGKEIYAALLRKVHDHDISLVRALGGSNAADAADVFERVIKAVPKLDDNQTCWALKYSVAKRLIKQSPPKKIMKALGYKSVDSMLKREHVAKLYAAMQLTETDEWLKTFHAKYKSLTPQNFEKRKIDIVTVSGVKWQKFAELYTHNNRHTILAFRELGAIVAFPVPVKSMPGLAITLLTLLLRYCSELRMYSAYFKLHQMKSTFGKEVLEALFAEDLHVARLAGQPVRWRVLHRHYSRNGSHPEVLEPHIQPEDLHWRHAGMVLAKLVPDMLFWHDTDFVGMMSSGQPISFNLIDMAINYCNKIAFEDRVHSHMRDALWNEIMARYVGQEQFESAVLRQLDEAHFETGSLKRPEAMAAFRAVQEGI